MRKVTVKEVEDICKAVGVGLINRDEKTEFAELEKFLVERSDGTPIITCYGELESAALPEWYG